VTDPIKVSASLYATYQKCPQQALARHQGVYSPTTRAGFRGSLAHKVFASHLDDGPIPEGEFLLRCRQLAGEHLGESMAGLRMKPTEFKAMVSEIEDMYSRFRRISTDGFVSAEEPIEADVHDGIVLRGRIDAVFDDGLGARIVDWKTGSFLDDTDAQMDFYALAWRLVHGAPPTMTEATSLATGEQVQRHPDEISTDQTLADVEAMVAAIRSAVETMTELERIAGPHCQWCPLLDECSEGNAAMEILDA